MKGRTKEENQVIQSNLEKLQLDLENIPNIFEIDSKIIYKPLKEYDNSSYKVYRYISVKDIDIYITPTTRLEDTDKKYKLARPLIQYLQPSNEEQIETYVEFLQMVKKLDLESLEKLEEEQKQFQNKIPFEIKYKDNFIWDIYYSEVEDRYFMMFPSEETQVEPLFYLIKKKIQLQKNSKKDEKIYIPINNKELDYEHLKRTEFADLENYLWYFTGNWPSIYEVQDKNGKNTVQILGKTQVYEKVKSLYKIVFSNKDEAEKQFKLLKALFILKSNMEQEYTFKTALGENGELCFFYNHTQITYNNLAEFIKKEIENKKEKIKIITEKNLFEKERLILIKETIKKQNIEYLSKEKQIVTFLECKKSFFGRVSYFIKGKKKKEKEKIINIEENNNDKEEKIENSELEIETKEFYTIEDLLKIGTSLEEKEKEYKNTQIDIKTLENKKEILETKIKNATLYINEIESHKKSIFDFWKFTNKDETSLLNEGKEEEQPSINKIKKVFSYEEDIEDLGEKIDEKQRKIFNQKEYDALFSIYKDLDVFNILRKEKLLKKDEKQIEKQLLKRKQQYEENYDQIKAKDFDIFGNVVEDKTKIKILKNNKHREIEKDYYKILNINLDTQLDEYKDNIIHYKKIIEQCYEKMTSPYDLSVYEMKNETIENNNCAIMNINPKIAIKKANLKNETLILNRINIKEDMPVVFYSNIIFYDNLNQTLPNGMDITTEVLIDLNKYESKLVSRKDFKMNFLEDEFENIVRNIEVYEYDLIRKVK